MSRDPSYYAARATEERRLAMAASDPRVRRVHLELAAEYAVLGGIDLEPSNNGPREAEQRTA
jgi:hypothetical protein